MSNSTNIDALLTAVDQATRPFKNLQTANASLAAGIKETEKNLSGLYNQLAQVEGLTQAEKSLSTLSLRLQTVQLRAQKLTEQGPPTRSHASILNFTQERVTTLQQQHETTRGAVIDHRLTLLRAGVEPNAPTAAKLQLQSQINDHRAQLITQQQALKQENRQKRAEKIQAGQQTIQGIAGKISAVGNIGMSVATSGFNIGKKLLQPGYEQSLKNNAPVQPGSEVSIAANTVSTPSAVSAPGALSTPSSVSALSTSSAPGAPGALSAQSAQSALSTPSSVSTPSAVSAPSAVSTPSALSAQVGNLGTDLQALQSVYQSLSVDIFSTQESSLRQLVQTATQYLGQLQQWVQNNQGLVQTFGLIATAVVGVAGAIGTVAGVIAPVFTGISTLITIATTFGSVFTTVCGGIMAVLGSLTLPIVGVITLVAAAALAIYTYWEPISAFFGGVMAGISAAFAPLAGLFAPLQPLFDLIGNGLQNIKQLFSDLITPVQASQETLNQCAKAGFYFGQMLSGSIALVIEGVKILGSSLSWVLEKLGIIDKKPVLEVPKPPTDASASQSYIQPTSTMPGFNNYQAAKPAGGNSYVDQSKTEYNVTLQGDIAPGSNNERYLQDLFRQDAANKRNSTLSQFNPSGGF
ncbi:phage tail tape measure protein, TP901 family, core region [Kosakonia arachidis]|uniref:Phage tail tape measure protein, TP901 family, core region n=1 Tax=Kosakonia arachidis TaxID=551989 RepID=A0A1I7E5S4_9ENTR|nr:phage tail tape measure protein [Kosakonia arachidis]SFU19259.1 phage tail tape measure protein, TP901 family, core region [Kosakonia arachidis]